MIVVDDFASLILLTAITLSSGCYVSSSASMSFFYRVDIFDHKKMPLFPFVSPTKWFRCQRLTEQEWFLFAISRPSDKRLTTAARALNKRTMNDAEEQEICVVGMKQRRLCDIKRIMRNLWRWSDKNSFVSVCIRTHSIQFIGRQKWTYSQAMQRIKTRAPFWPRKYRLNTCHVHLPKSIEKKFHRIKWIKTCPSWLSRTVFVVQAFLGLWKK